MKVSNFANIHIGYKSKIGIFLLILLVIVILYACSHKFLSLLSDNPENNRTLEEISDRFIILPKEKYSLDDQEIIIPPNTNIAPIIPESIAIEITVENKFAKPVWGKGRDCNHHGVLEKKTLTGWIIADEEKCSKINQLFGGRFFNNGLNELRYVLRKEEARGNYRARINLLYGCRATKDSDDSIRYDNCEGEVISYSPTFKIQ